jgi:two-component system LytT family response regulator
MRYRSFLVENEEHSLARLKRILAELPQEVEIVGEAMDGPTAVQKIRELNPDLLFLDIDLPGLNGFQVLDALPRQPAVIFTTAFNQHALDAFKTHAVDYLLKPIEPLAVARALAKMRALGVAPPGSAQALQQVIDQFGSRYLTRLTCRLGDRTFLVKIGEVLYLQADHKYTAVHTSQRELLIETPLVELEGRLNPRDFVRVHRSTLVNAAWISEIRRSFDGKTRVVLSDPKATELLVSRLYADNLRNL